MKAHCVKNVRIQSYSGQYFLESELLGGVFLFVNKENAEKVNIRFVV